MVELVTARMGDCTCPGRPHSDGDEAYLLPKMGLEGLAAAEYDMMMVADLPDSQKAVGLLARWTVTYVRYGAVGWNLKELRDGKLVDAPFDVEALVADGVRAKPVAEVAAELYGDTVTGPLVDRMTKAANTSPPTSTDESMSPESLEKRLRFESSSEPDLVGELSATNP